MDVGLAPLALRRLAADSMPAPSTLNDNDRQALIEAFVLMNPFDMARADPGAIVAAVTRGRALVHGLPEVPGRLGRVLAAAPAGVWRRQVLPWVIAHEPDRLDEFLPAAFYLGACYAAGGRDREAAGAWQTSLITESEARVVYDVLSDALLRLQDAPAAIDILAEARGRWPDDDAFVPRLAAAYAIGNRRADAFRELAPYLDRHPGDAEALFLAMRLVYDAHAAGATLLTSAEDASAMARYAALYKAAGGASVQLVERWAQFVGQGGARQ